MPQHDTRSIGGLYRTGQVVATGSIFTTYTAYDRNTNDVVGLSVIEASLGEQWIALSEIPQMLTRRQAVQSAHVLKLHTWGVENGHIYIATDPPRGVTLQHILNTEDVNIFRALDISRQLVLALMAFHAQEVAGLDLRPQLITIDTIGVTDRVQIDDIGLRSILHSLNYVSSQNLNDPGYLDPRYAPPEYIQSGATGPWSDIYQIGILLFTLITGRLPFVGRTIAETGILQTTMTIPPMSQYTHQLPRGLQEIVERCMEKEPSRRFLSAHELMVALEKLQSDIQPASGGSTELAGIAPTREISSIAGDTFLHEAQSRESKGQTMTTTNLPTELGIYAYLTYEKKGKDKSAPELQRIPLMQKSVIVGRNDPKRGVSPDIDLSLFDPEMTVSRLHARISFEGSFFYIEDLKSRNKTHLGALVLTPMKAELLQHEDIVRFGRVRMRFQIPGMGNVASMKKEEASH